MAVDRTCTEIRPGSGGRVELSESRPLSAFGSLEAYVLLGDPGAGKTTEFKKESRALGGAAEYIRARGFIWPKLKSRPEWRDKTLFIDGLDEMRAGAADSRLPLDEILNRLDRLGCPKFRISCREADWLGDNDRRSLEAVSPDSRIAMLRLDPLSEQAAVELLSSRNLGVSAKEFLQQARRRGVGGLLSNPLTLGLLADAVRHGGGWPAGRLETFETACRRMATEQNAEHREGASPQSVETVLDAAGYLCALQLLSGIDGYSFAPSIDGSSFVSLDTLEDAREHRSRTCLQYALATRLFTAIGERTFSPVHRLVAEFLAGRYLAELIRDGLPARRVVALMTGAGDGRVVTVLRGLSAWLAAHPSEARRQLIDADPVGVGIYGDIGDFTTGDKQRLLRSLATFATEGPLSGHQWRDGRADEARYDSAWAFRSLASPDMASPINELLGGRGAGASDDRITGFVLDVLSEADASEVGSLIGLESTVEAILCDAATSPEVRWRALGAYMRIAPDGDARTHTLTWLLQAVHDRRLPDPDDELLGNLLDRLYPTVIAPSQVWRYVLLQNRSDFHGRFWQFWEVTVVERSSDQQTAALLDALHEDASRLISALGVSQFEDLPLRLLVRGLETLGDHAEPSRLYDWLSTVGRCLLTSLAGEHARHVRAWLEARPEIQKTVFMTWLAGRESNDPSSPDDYWRCSALHESSLPDDFGPWCLDQALAIGDAEPVVSTELLRKAHESLRHSSTGGGLTLDVLRVRTRGHPPLAQHLDELCQQRSSDSSAYRDPLLEELEARREQKSEEQRQHRQEWVDAIRVNETELRENRFSPPGLDTLARAFFDLFVETDRGLAPRDRIGYFTGDDERLVEAVMAGLREALTRDDVPDVEQTIALRSESKHSWLAFPVLASLQILDEEDPARLDGLDDTRKRSALAIYYCVPLGHGSHRWHARWLSEDPELVLDVLYKCAVAAVRAGDDAPPGLNNLDGVTGHDELVHDLRLRLLRAYPTRGSNKQLGLLDRLLAEVMKCPDDSALRSLVWRKLASTSMGVAQRVRWLAVDSLLSGGPGFQELKTWVGESERRIRHLAEFLRNVSYPWHLGDSSLDAAGDPVALKDTIEMLGRSYRPLNTSGLVTLEMATSDRIFQLITQLESLPTEEAHRVLRDLIAEPRLTPWHDRLAWALARQSVIHRDASYCHPTIEEAQSTLSNQAPANVADLAALLVERLHDVSEEVRGGNSNPWRQFWNEDSNGRPTDAKPENSCRDALLAALQERLPAEVDVVPEGRYAADRRADIRASSDAFNVPIEIKKNSHRDLWSALRSQLIGQYTTDPATGGYGIFLVLWFGYDVTKPPPDGNHPATPEELQRRLERDLTPDEARKVTVVVMDATKP